MLQKEPHPPSPFLQSCTKGFSELNSPIYPTGTYLPLYRTISTLDRHFFPIMAHTMHTQSITFGDNNANCNNTIGCYNTTIYSSDEDAKIMGWVSPLESENRHHSLRTDRFGGAGDWLSGTEEFREWNGGEGGADRAVLFCSGDPGVGKTHLRLVARFS